MLTTLLLAIALIGLAVAGFAVKIIFQKDGKFNGTCSSNNPYLQDELGQCSVCGSTNPAEECKADGNDLPIIETGKI